MRPGSKKLNQLRGPEGAVNLATEKATVEYDDNQVKVADLIKVVEELGYQAARTEEGSGPGKGRKSKGDQAVRKELTIAVVLSSPLLLAMIVSLLRIDLPFLHNEYFQLLIATPIQFIIGWRFYKTLIMPYGRKAPIWMC